MKGKKLSIIILAAGLGTRMKSSRPKVLHKICEKSMISHILREALALSDDVSVVLAHQKDLIRAELEGEFTGLRFLEQDMQSYPGTAGALRGYEPRYERVLILCGDMPLITRASLAALAGALDGAEGTGLVLGVFEAADPKNYGRVLLEGQLEGRVAGIVEFRDASPAQRELRLCNAGVYAVAAPLLRELLPLIGRDNAAGEYYLTELASLAAARGLPGLAFFVDEGEFMGVNDKIALAWAEIKMQKRIQEKWMSQGVIMHNPRSIFIGPDVEFIGECELFENVKIQGKSRIEDCIIKASTIIEDSIIQGSQIGPLAHLRPGCEVRNSVIGNFVECKKAVLNGVKAGHLSYLGDCEIGPGTNIGCGVITCNFDGRAKYKTIIEGGVFVGSDVQFIAPVRVGERAVIAAGSCVDADLPAGALFINRAEKRIIKGYFEKKFAQAKKAADE